MLVGVVTPLAALLFGDEDGVGVWFGDDVPVTDWSDINEQPLETLGCRYAEGELTDREFEEKAEHLVRAVTPQTGDRALSTGRTRASGRCLSEGYRVFRPYDDYATVR